MRKAWMVLAVTTATSGALFAAACGSDTTENTPSLDGSAAPNDAAQAADAHDAGTFVERDAECTCPTCYDTSSVEIPEGATEFRTHQNRCSGADIDAFIATCLALDGGPDAGGACNDFLSTHRDCSSCLIGRPTGDAGGADAAPTWPAVEFISYDSVIADTDGCLAASADAGEACALGASASSLCLQSACSSCDDSIRGGCLTYAANDMSGCSSVVPVSPACADAVDAAAQSIGSTCGADAGLTLEQRVKLVGTVLCGS